MGGNTFRPPSRPNSNTHDNKKKAAKQSAKKHKKWSKSRSEQTREALDRDAVVLYDVFEKSSTKKTVVPPEALVLNLAESIQNLGK